MLFAFIAPKVPLDRPEIVMEISWKRIENPESGATYYHFDSTTITTTIAKDLSSFVRNLKSSMGEIFWRLDAAVPFLRRLPPDGNDKRTIALCLWRAVCEVIWSRGSGGFMLRFEFTVAFDQSGYTIIHEDRRLITAPTDSDSFWAPLLQLLVDADSLCCCVICLDEFFREESKVGWQSAIEWLPCAHGFHHDCINSWFQRSRTCPICRRTID